MFMYGRENEPGDLRPRAKHRERVREGASMNERNLDCSQEATNFVTFCSICRMTSQE